LQSSGEGSFPHPVKRSWKPLVLVVPLRLGLSEINPVYVQGLKVRAACVRYILRYLFPKAEDERKRRNKLGTVFITQQFAHI
jgi:hypothetical protein